MPPLMTGSAANHLSVAFSEIIGTALGGRRSYYSRLYNVKTTKRNYEDVFAATGMPIAVQKPEGVDIQSFDPKEGGTLRISPETFAIACEFSEEVWEDDQYVGDGSMIRDAANGLSESFAERVEIEAHRPFNVEGFSTSPLTYPVLPDSTVPFFSAAHPPIVGGQGPTQSNLITADINITSLQAMFTSQRKLKDDQGKRIPGVATPRLVIVPPDSEWIIREIKNSPGRADTANRVSNELATESWDYLVDEYIEDPGNDSWFVQAAKHYLNFYWRWRPRTDTFDDRRARVMVSVLYGRFVPKPIHWLGYMGSQGV